MTDNQIITPVIVHLFTAILQLVFWRKTVTQRILSITGCLIGFALSLNLFTKVLQGGILTMNAANWQPPFGIVFVADLLSSTLVLLTSVSALAVCIFSATGIARSRMLYGYFPIFHFLVMGLNGAFLTGDIFNQYVWFEVIIIASFVLLTLGGRKAQLEGAVKYMALNILASTFFLTGIALLYGITGTLNMADLSQKVPLVKDQSMVNLISVFFLTGFGIKAAVFPLYFWLPSSYHTPPSAVAAIFGGLLTKVGLYALFRFFTLVIVPDNTIRIILMGMAVLTILTGAFGAIIKNNIRRLFSYLIVCHIGFIIGGLGTYSKVAFAGAIFYLIHDIMVKTNMFLIAGLIRQLRGTMDMDRLGGLYAGYPKISLLIAIVLFSLTGVPPLSGFWPKILLFSAAFDTSNYAFIGSLVLGSFITLYVVARMWSKVFWKSAPEDPPPANNFDLLSPLKKTSLVLPVCILASSSLFIGLNAEFIARVADTISNEMIDTTPYIKAVLGK
ncbi:proton-conducting transporter transmembrane domain-containing protein [Pararcticibacter amylolyticus]|uniref:Na+/H+ antiporter subunit D n=1 Tax=Pararcticibacter amylolyticus TaxID=2173175 RepID=A0A2U2PF29_9SPHI|nr:proton-conducting transporter membrane subunit [Pararcticibacter amylolyticus]PWG79934.1 Na+/H+ antiporter subunit D [Pararcticibacter amylolyticus]